MVSLVEYRIFIAYASEDTAFAGQIRNSLSKISEFRPYLANEYPIYGSNFKERIQNAIQDSNYLIVILTKDGVASQWVNQELGYACAI
ncbi:toll/interleukin-1 receptor domain-containing protein, partial [Candidatus Bathyarchaeota archaeon]|nr:toll/interleukin-1 receptor domain-containing protein [Candidatus Bathyarchaeota archaeon]